MNTRILLLAVGLLDFVFAGPTTNGKANKKDYTTYKGIKEKLHVPVKLDEKGGLMFPERLQGLQVDDKGQELSIDAKRVNVQAAVTAVGEGTVKHSLDLTDSAFYASENGIFHVTGKKKSDGSVETVINSLQRDKSGQRCFGRKGRLECWTESEVDFENWEEVLTVPEVKRRKRQMPSNYTEFYTSGSTRVFEVIYIVDAKFMAWFRARNPNNEAGAVAEVALYITLLNTEITYLYRSIDENTGGNLEIVLYAVALFYPLPGNDWGFVAPYIRRGALDYNYVFPALGSFIESTNMYGYQYDHVSLLTGQNLNSNVLGVAYLATACLTSPTQRRYKCSIITDIGYDLARIFGHEFGHSLSAEHDGSGNACPNNLYLMAPAILNSNSGNLNSFYKFSNCSTTYFTNYLAQNRDANNLDCLQRTAATDNQFLDQFCSGVRGETFNIDYQCQIATKLQTSVACSNVVVSGGNKLVTASSCYQSSAVGCNTTSSSCSSTLRDVDFGTPCQGPDPAQNYVCYRKSCVLAVDLCANRTTTSVVVTLPGKCYCSSGRRLDQCCLIRNPDQTCCDNCSGRSGCP